MNREDKANCAVWCTVGTTDSGARGGVCLGVRWFDALGDGDGVVDGDVAEIYLDIEPERGER